MTFIDDHEGAVAVVEMLSKEEVAQNVLSESVSADEYAHGLWLRLNGGVTLNFYSAIMRFCLSIGVNSYNEWRLVKPRYSSVPSPIVAAIDWSNAQFVDRDAYYKLFLKRSEKTSRDGDARHDVLLKKFETTTIPGWYRDCESWLALEYVEGNSDAEKRVRRLKRRLVEVMSLTDNWLANHARVARVAAELSKEGASAKDVFAKSNCLPSRGE